MPVTSIRRQAETDALVRVMRQPEREVEWRNVLGAKTHGLKRGPAPELFLLRSNTHSLDFLLSRVPQLTQAGYEIYGEEELKLARVNRHRPSISFGVTSGIDWFDVQAVVSFARLGFH